MSISRERHYFAMDLMGKEQSKAENLRYTILSKYDGHGEH
jgi:hypothetical protein